MIVLQNDDATAAGDRDKLRRGGDAVADRGYQRDVGRIGMDQPRSRGPRALVLGVGERSIQSRPACWVLSGNGL
jgi:hypothetical protein